MGWYDHFARIYDDALQPLYAEHRRLACEALQLRPGQRVLDLPCGTGASLPGLAAGVGPGGAVLAVDSSAGMLRQARARLQHDGLDRVSLLQARGDALDAAALEEALGVPQVDRLHVFLGMSVFSDMAGTFRRLWSLLAPGGRCVLVDVHADPLGFQGRMVNLVARADIRRRFWEPLAAVAPKLQHRDLPHHPKHGGQIMLAVADKPT